MHNKVDWEQVKQIVIKAVKTLVIKVKEFFRGMRTNIANVIKIATTAFKSSNFDKYKDSDAKIKCSKLLYCMITTNDTFANGVKSIIMDYDNIKNKTVYSKTDLLEKLYGKYPDSGFVAASQMFSFIESFPQVLRWLDILEGVTLKKIINPNAFLTWIDKNEYLIIDQNADYGEGRKLTTEEMKKINEHISTAYKVTVKNMNAAYALVFRAMKEAVSYMENMVKKDSGEPVETVKA